MFRLFDPLSIGVNTISANSGILSHFTAGVEVVDVYKRQPHVSGSLYHILGIFARENLNLSKIESRPIADKNWEYLFFLDFTAETIDSRINGILEEISKASQTLKILGYYKNAIGVEQDEE